MRVEAKVTGLDRAIAKLTKYYDQVITSNEATAIFARNMILRRIETGKTAQDVQMKYKPKSGIKKLRAGIGDYSYRHGKDRRDGGYSTSPYSLKMEGNLYRAFAYRRSRTANTMSLRFYIKNSQTKAENPISHPELVDLLEGQFGKIFYPSMGEVREIKKYFKNNFRR